MLFELLEDFGWGVGFRGLVFLLRVVGFLPLFSPLACLVAFLYILRVFSNAPFYKRF